MLFKLVYIVVLDNGCYIIVEGYFVDVKLGGEGEIEVNDVMVMDVDVSVNNGIIYIINKVLMFILGKRIFLESLYSIFKL